MKANRERLNVVLGSAAILALLVMPIAFAGADDPQTAQSAGLRKQIKKLKQRVAALEGKPDQVGSPAPPPGVAPDSARLGGIPPNGYMQSFNGTSRVISDIVDVGNNGNFSVGIAGTGLSLQFQNCQNPVGAASLPRFDLVIPTGVFGAVWVEKAAIGDIIVSHEGFLGPDTEPFPVIDEEEDSTIDLYIQRGDRHAMLRIVFHFNVTQTQCEYNIWETAMQREIG